MWFSKFWWEWVFPWKMLNLCLKQVMHVFKSVSIAVFWTCKYGFDEICDLVHVCGKMWKTWCIVWNDEMHVNMTCYVYACGNWNVHRIDCVKWIIMNEYEYICKMCRVWCKCIYMYTRHIDACDEFVLYAWSYEMMWFERT